MELGSWELFGLYISHRLGRTINLGGNLRSSSAAFSSASDLTFFLLSTAIEEYYYSLNSGSKFVFGYPTGESIAIFFGAFV